MKLVFAIHRANLVMLVLETIVSRTAPQDSATMDYIVPNQGPTGEEEAMLSGTEVSATMRILRVANRMVFYGIQNAKQISMQLVAVYAPLIAQLASTISAFPVPKPPMIEELGPLLAARVTKS
jgi:hypothetical protein